MTLSDSRQHRRPRRRRGRDPHAWAGLPSYPRHPSGVPCPLPRWTAAGASVGCFPATCSLPRNSGGSASTTSLSRPAQASLALRPVGSLSRPRRPLSRGFDPSGCPDRPLVSYQINRQLSGWNLPPLVARAIWAHVESRTGAVAWAMRQRSVSRPRSSNRTCGFPASGFPTGFTSRHTAGRQDEPGGAAARRGRRTPPHRGSAWCRATAPCDAGPGSGGPGHRRDCQPPDRP